MSHPLDNIIWNTLTTRHEKFADKYGQIRVFAREIGPLAGFSAPDADRYAELADIVRERNIALFLREPFQAQPGLQIVGGAPLYQMVCEKENFSPAVSDAPILMLNNNNSSDMIELTGLTKPGPFGPRTHELGSFFGIRDNGRLAAMAGERMKVPEFTEISAVCTHPAHLGKGYAAALISRVAQGIVNAGETPFLHVRADNQRAIDVYERLGFRKRTIMHYVILSR